VHIRREDFSTNAWRRLERDLQERLQVLREQNDGWKTDEVQTALIRGRIDEVKRILGLAKLASPGNEEQPV
jgi:hypothetical protein